MAQVWIPQSMQRLTGGQERVPACGSNVRQVVADLDRRFPGLTDALVVDGRLKPDIAVAVNGTVTPLGLLETVGDEAEIHFLPAITGG